MDHCMHCPGENDPRHDDPAFAKAEADCAFYEKPENLATTGPGRKRRSRPQVTALRYEPPSCGPQTVTSASGRAVLKLEGN